MGIKKRKSKKGFTVIEAVISLVLFTVIMIPLGSFTLTAVKTSVKSATKEQAINAGQGALEQLKTLKLSQLNTMKSSANSNESNKDTIKIGDLTVTKEKSKTNYEVSGKYTDPNNSKVFNIDGTITQSKLENNIDDDTEHSFDDSGLGIDYMVDIGNSSITVQHINISNKESEVKPNWYVIKYNNIKDAESDKKRILNLMITKDKDGKIDIGCDNEGDPVHPYDNSAENKIVDNNINNIKVYFYEDSVNKEINLKISNKCIGSTLNIYTYKNRGSGVIYNVYTSTDNSQGDINIFKNCIEGSSADLRGQLFNINLNVKDTNDNILYNLNTTEFIGE